MLDTDLNARSHLLKPYNIANIKTQMLDIVATDGIKSKAKILKLALIAFLWQNLIFTKLFINYNYYYFFPVFCRAIIDIKKASQ